MTSPIQTLCLTVGAGLLRLYGSSLKQTIFPDKTLVPMEIQSATQKRQAKIKIVESYWVRKASDTEFLDDWYRVSVSQLHRIGGTTMIQNNRGLASVLERIYPSHHWAQKYLWSKKSFTLWRKKSSQRFSKLILKELFPKSGQILLPCHLSILFFDTSFFLLLFADILEDYSHLKLLFPQTQLNVCYLWISRTAALRGWFPFFFFVCHVMNSRSKCFFFWLILWTWNRGLNIFFSCFKSCFVFFVKVWCDSFHRWSAAHMEERALHIFWSVHLWQWLWRRHVRITCAVNWMDGGLEDRIFWERRSGSIKSRSCWTLRETLSYIRWEITCWDIYSSEDWHLCSWNPTLSRRTTKESLAATICSDTILDCPSDMHKTDSATIYRAQSVSFQSALFFFDISDWNVRSTSKNSSFITWNELGWS